MVSSEYQGNLFDSGCQTLVCPVNTKGAMGSGLALYFRKRVPGLYEAYQEACKSGELTTERVWVYKNPDQDFQVLCLASKEEWWFPSKYKYVEGGLTDIAARWEELGIESLAIPPVGCGLGQLDYPLCVKPMIESILGPLELPVDILFI